MNHKSITTMNNMYRPSLSGKLVRYQIELICWWYTMYIFSYTWLIWAYTYTYICITGTPGQGNIYLAMWEDRFGENGWSSVQALTWGPIDCETESRYRRKLMSEEGYVKPTTAFTVQLDLWNLEIFSFFSPVKIWHSNTLQGYAVMTICMPLHKPSSKFKFLTKMTTDPISTSNMWCGNSGKSKPFSMLGVNRFAKFSSVRSINVEVCDSLLRLVIMTRLIESTLALRGLTSFRMILGQSVPILLLKDIVETSVAFLT